MQHQFYNDFFKTFDWKYRVYGTPLVEFRKTLPKNYQTALKFDKYIYWVENGGLVSVKENKHRIHKLQSDLAKEEQEQKKEAIRGEIQRYERYNQIWERQLEEKKQYLAQQGQ